MRGINRYQVMLLSLLAGAGSAGPALGGDFGWWHGHHDGWWRHDGNRRGISDFCAATPRERSDKVERIISAGPAMFDFTPRQQAAWADLADAIRHAAKALRTSCENPMVRTKTAPDELARMEESMVAGLAALNRLKPSFGRFYDTLDEKQRERLDRAFASRN